MNVSLLIKSGLVVDPASKIEKTMDIRITDGVIREMKDNISPNKSETVFDAKDLWLTPGFFDMHTHLRDLSQTDSEDIETGTLAAAAGGYTSVLAMANTVPPVDNLQILKDIIDRIGKKAHVQVYPVACVTKQMAGAELTGMVQLAEAGACAFSDDGKPIENLAVLKRGLKHAKLADRIIISHPEDLNLSGGGVFHESRLTTCLGLPPIPAASEAAAIAREIEVAREADAPLHFAHVSCKTSLDLIRFARSQGVRITADVTPHHICLSIDDIPGFDANYKMKPPLRESTDRKAIVDGLKDGTLQAIATDHAPHCHLDKSKSIYEAPFGITGLETAFSVTFSELVLTNQLGRMEFIALFTTGPARALKLPEPTLKVGNTADVSIFSPSAEWKYDARKDHSRSSNSPFDGCRLKGKNVMTICRGKTVFEDESIIPQRMVASTVGG